MNQRYVIVRKTSAGDGPVDYAAKKRWIIVLLFAYAALVGVMTCFLPEDDTPLDTIIGAPFVILGISWCFADANDRFFRIGGLTKFSLVFLFLVGFPLYLIQSRGLRGLATLGLTFLLVVGMMLCVFLTNLLTLFVGEAFGAWQVIS